MTLGGISLSARRAGEQAVLMDLAAVEEWAGLGGKGAGLAKLIRAGLPVPPTWVLPAEVLTDHLARSALAALAQQAESHPDGDEQLSAARRLRSALLREPLPRDVAEAVAGLLQKLQANDGRTSLAVRSSATCEGLPGASFAGQFQTFLDVQDLDQVCAALRSCWASLWSTSALRYRAAQSGDPRAPGMAVLLQVFVPATAAGATRVHDAGVEIESAWGLGPAVMSGLVIPDRFWIDIDGVTLGAEPGRKPVRASAVGGNLVWETVPPEQREALSLDEKSTETVACLALGAAKALGTPTRVEWALCDDAVWLLQGALTEQVPSFAMSPTYRSATGVLRGIPTAPGEVTGRVRLVRELEELDHVDSTDIVVSPYASPAMAARCQGAGWITEMGGASGHAASLARERRLPMVTGVLGATQRLRDGQLVRLDGTRGLVEISDSAAFLTEGQNGEDLEGCLPAPLSLEAISHS